MHNPTYLDANRPARDGFGQLLRNVHWKRQLILQRAGVYQGSSSAPISEWRLRIQYNPGERSRTVIARL